MECPCGCEICGEIFDLDDGIASERLTQSYGNTIICESCGKKECEEIEIEEEISNLKQRKEECEYEIKSINERLSELGEKV